MPSTYDNAVLRLKPMLAPDGLRTIYRCPSCGCSVNVDHVIEGAECDMLALERERKWSE
jgi:hypothetical protein